METNTCDVNNLDTNALLPPRKRLLAGLKRQSSPSTESEYDARLNDLLRSHLSNPLDEIVGASRIAAVKAAKVAEAARANAEQKAVKAAKAVAAAKNALDLVATLSEESDKLQKKNKTKKHVPVQALYNKKKKGKGKGKASCRSDEKMARELHKAINSSPRTLRKSPDADSSKNRKNKKMKIANSAINGNGVGKGIDMLMVDLNSSEHDRDEDLGLDSREVPENGEVRVESLDSFGKRRKRIKQKKMPLNICSSKDQSSSPKEETKTQQLFSVENSSNSLIPIEKASMWKCHAFKAPACLAQNKVMQS
ncbi:hypothetical protein ABFS82_06G030600 [Erythranthe guttata]|uniref:Uncharacterized protein n=1 Tax=Erythranthe guttata TaxID=4155 RepID=A0A022QCZ2_ERYGU|nr:PREDICTED: uncharacterized protein LOC105971870 [Erythranthe guttata]EYU25128.1 hypothetical protein MIMGU_mgv1a010589mg [Erythranthe guttata]|eukprot:XP_012852244.1 PREDICTED: uncharacterized protein LOC105971870 [Erythranthe guttata]